MSWTDPETLKLGPTDFMDDDRWNAAMDVLTFYGNPPQAAVRLTSSQTVADSTPHTITWQESNWAPTSDPMWDSAAPSKVVAKRNGPHRVMIHTEYTSVIPVDEQSITLEVNTAVRLGPIAGQQLIIETNLAIGDELEAICEQITGASVDLVATRTRMTVVWSGNPLTETST